MTPLNHDHDQACGHHHHVHGHTQGPLLWVSLAVTLLFVIGEAIAGKLAHSLALLSDAGHNFSDAFALGLAAYALWIAKKPATARRTFGYHRVAILTALFNASTLIVIALIILGDAYRLFRAPEPVQGGLMAAVAAVSVLMNTVIAVLLSRGAAHSLNVRAAYIHMAGDALSALAVLVAGWVVQATGWLYADPLVSVLIALFILYSSWGIVRDATDILLESTPKGVDVDAIVAALRGVRHVQAVHDLHIWTVSDGLNFLSVHVEVSDARSMEDCACVIRDVNALLAHDFGIGHATIQMELAGACSGMTDDPLFCGELASVMSAQSTEPALSGEPD